MEVSRKGFNDKQLQAIDSPLGSNVIISAGAGSGKTATLSTKVMKLVFEDHVDPASLLVLTFTDKAAHEMKEKILKKFNESNENKEIAQQIQSAHIQTFDSFSLYLVKKYSSFLGLPDSIAIGDENIISVQKKEALDQIFDEFYEKKDKQFLSTNQKFNFLKDDTTKEFVLELDKKLSSFIPSEKDRYIQEYENRYLSDESILSFFEQYLKLLKEKAKKDVDMATFTYLHKESDASELKNIILDPNSFANLDGVSFSTDAVNSFAEDIQHLLSLSGQDFLSFLKEMEAKEYMDGRKKKIYNDYPEEKELAKAYRESIKTLKTSLSDYGTFEEQKELLQSFRNDIFFLFDVVKELEKRTLDIKKQTSAFEFSDIAQFALSLLTEDKYQDIAKEIKNRFTYILVDEYQDTNDFQELFLNKISDSEKSTLFVVGDAKQSIYGFRNANCQLFLNRREKYYSDHSDKELVVEMNTNYRSVKKLLDDINEIFVHYMSKDHGGITFAEKREQLDYDDKKADLYQADMLYEKGEYGINILSYSSMKQEAKGNVTNQEILMIIEDILNKIRNKYQIVELKDGKPFLRDCTFKDFAILLRKKKNFAPYKKLFAEYGIPINNNMEEHLFDVDCITALGTLVNLISARMGYSQANIPHLFASLARSYLFGKEKGYTDQKIYDLIRSDEKHTAMYLDPIMVKIDEFCKNNKEEFLATIFLHLLSAFDVISSLNRLGQVNDAISKIDSYYSLILSQQQMGQGLKEFVDLFKNINKYKVELSSSSVVNLDNAVELTTIHKSKGLEYPLVYLPNSENYLSSGSNLNAPKVTFTSQYGLLLPNYRNGNLDEEGILCSTFLDPLYKLTEGSIADEVSEHVRLFYVALTRAKESIYIVGNPSKKEEDLYQMLNYSFHMPKLNEEILTKERENIPSELLSQYEQITSLYQKDYFDAPKNIGTPFSEIQSTLYQNMILSPEMEQLQQVLHSIEYSLCQHYLKQLFNASFEDSYHLFLTYNGLPQMSLTEFEKMYSEEYSNQSFASLLDSFISALENEDLSALGIEVKINKKDTEEDVRFKKETTFIDHFLNPMAMVFDHIQDSVEKESYAFRQKTISSSAKLSPLDLVNNSYKLNQHYDIDDTSVSCEEKEKRRASKFSPDEENITVKQLGVRYHHDLELVDFKSKDTSFIKDNKERSIVDKVLSLHLFDLSDDDKVYAEYSYYDEELQTSGFIDCLIVKKDCLLLIDYKLKHIDDEAYQKQLATYERNLDKLYPGKKVKKYLLSILDGNYQEVK